jgi:hypothetical protein
MLEVEKQLSTEDAQSSDAVSAKEPYCDDGGVLKKTRPKLVRRKVVDGKPVRGRPSNKALAKKKNPGVVGRPPGDAARIAEFRARLLATHGDSVIEKIITTALQDGHPAQGAMLKFCGERLLPLSGFEGKNGGGTPQISINISGLTNTTIEADEVIDNDVTDVTIKDIDES